ncbi:MAG: hypothetical protein AAB426_09530 [Myxococcota bacterium]
MTPPEVISYDCGCTLPIVITVLLLSHTSFVFTAYLLHYYDGATTGRVLPTLASYLRAGVWESWYELVSTLSYPLGWLPSPSPLAYDPMGGPPVVLVHGYIRNRGSMLVIYWRLKRAGFRNIYNLGLGNTLAPIEVLAERVRTRLTTIATLTQGAPLVGIGHSMGGIVLRWCVDHGAPIGRIITIATPHRGTRMAYVAPGESAVQLRPDSVFLASLSDPPSVPLTALYTTHDNIVVPCDSAAYGDAPKRFEGRGHLTMLYDGEVFESILELLDTRRAEQAD